MDGVKTHVLQKLELWQYYVIDVEGHVQAFSSAWDQLETRSVSSLGEESLDEKSPDDATSLIQKYALRNRMALAARFATHVDVNLSISILRSIAGGQSKEQACAIFKKALDAINEPLYRTFDEDNAAIMDNLKSRLRYTRVNSNGPRMGKITKE